MKTTLSVGDVVCVQVGGNRCDGIVTALPTSETVRVTYAVKSGRSVPKRGIGLFSVLDVELVKAASEHKSTIAQAGA